MSSSSSGRKISEVVASLAVEAERAAVAQRDPAIRASMEAQYEGKVVAIDSLPELRRKERERRWREAGVPERMWPMLHDGAPDEAVGPRAPTLTQALAEVGRFLAGTDGRPGLILAGRPDTGKTFAAAWAAAWTPGGRLVKALALIRAGLYPADPGFWPRLHSDKLLVVDDLGADPLDEKGYGLAAITDLVDARYDSGARTIITTNLAAEEFRARYTAGPAERLGRRLRETYRFVELLDRKPLAGGAPGRAEDPVR